MTLESSPQGTGRATSALPPGHVLAAYRDLGTVEEGFGDRLACDPNFNRYASFWVQGPTLDATYGAIEGLRLFGRRGGAVLGEAREGVEDFVRDHYDPATGTFQTDGSERTAGIYAAHTALGVVKGLQGCRRDRPLGLEGFERRFGVGAAEKLLRFFREAADASPDRGAILDRPDSPLPPSVTVLYTAYLTLWNLFGSERAEAEMTGLVDRERLEVFLRECFKNHDLGGRRIAGFAIHPDVDEVCLNTSFFGLTLVRRLGLDILDELDLRRLQDFVFVSFRDGGFSSTLGEPRSLNATFFGLRLLKQLDKILGGHAFEDLKATAGPDIDAFTRSCGNVRNGGSAFSGALDRYVENCLATRYAHGIRDELGRGDGQREEERVLDFLRSQRDERTGGFRGYPSERVKMPAGWATEDLERLLEARDDELLRQLAIHPSRDREISALYQRLGALHRRRDRRQDREDHRMLDCEVERVLGRLRALQHDEAERQERAFDRRQWMPLDEAERIVAEGRAFIRKHGQDTPGGNSALR